MPVAEINETSFLPSTIESTGLRIRRPKLRIGSDGTFPSRPPYFPKRPRYGPTTEAGPPISIFSRQRTRIASITSSTTHRPFRPYSTVRVHHATLPNIARLSAPPTTTEEPIDEVPFTEATEMPVVSDEEGTILVKVAGYVALDRGIRWHPLLDNRQTPEYRDSAARVLLHLERLFRSSSIADRLWKIEIDGFSGSYRARPVGVDFFLYLVKSSAPVAPEQLGSIFKEKLTAERTFGTFRADADKTAFEVLQEEPLLKATPPPDDDEDGAEPPVPQWAIACIVIGAASLIFILLFAAVTLYGRHHMRRRYSTSKLGDEEAERGSGEWESKMAAAYENMAADTLCDDSSKKNSAGRIATFHGVPSPFRRGDSWTSTRVVAPRWTDHFQ